MPVSRTPAPSNKTKNPSKIITDFSNISQYDQQDENAEANELDLGTKIKAPRDVMLEELSLMKNKGSKMFKMRQKRVEKFIVSDENLNSVPSLQCDMTAPPEPSPKLEPSQEEVNAEAEKEKRRVEHAMKDDKKLEDTMKWKMPGPHVQKELPKYKSFNRVALPFGGFDKASRLVTFEAPEIKASEEEPQPAPEFNLSCRPSFNRTPIGWTCNEEHSHIHMELDNIPFDGETDDL